MKRPAAATASKKKPAKAPSHKPATAKGCKKKPGEGKGWQKSASFGWIKQTRASKKAYIQAKPGEGSKNPRGVTYIPRFRRLVGI